MEAGAKTGGEWLAHCRSILGGEQSKTGRVWQKAGTRDRRLLLLLAGCRGVELSRLVAVEWSGLSAGLRSGIECGLRRFGKWADEVCQE